MTEFIQPMLDEDEARIIRMALSKELGHHRLTTQLLKLARERELTEVERFQLPVQLRYENRDDLCDQINPWISLEMMYEYLIEKLSFKTLASGDSK